MWLVVVLNLIIFTCRMSCDYAEEDADSNDDFGEGLIAQMKNDANLDLPVDEEYEDLRAELLAYHTALAKLTAPKTRRTLISTPCWKLGGICIHFKLCSGFRFLTEVPGCKNKQNVCCFNWNKYQVRDFNEQGISGIHYPWSKKYDFGGKGLIDNSPENTEKPKRKKKKKTLSASASNQTDMEALALILRSL